MRKPIFGICKNKDADQLRSKCEADQRLCFRYTDSTIPLLSKSKLSSLWPSSVTVQLSMSNLFGNHIVGFLMAWLNYCEPFVLIYNRLVSLLSVMWPKSCWVNHVSPKTIYELLLGSKLVSCLSR